MPVRLNLLAEAQAAAELRRRDPVKRAIWVAVFMVLLMLGWNGWLQLGIILTKRDMAAMERQMATRSKERQQTLDNQKKLAEIQRKVSALRQLAASRYLNGPMLDALQRAIVEDVQLVRLRTEMAYAATEAQPRRTNMANGRVMQAEPATATEKTLLTLEGKDSGPFPREQVAPYKQAIGNHPYFKHALGKTNVVQLVRIDEPTAVVDKPYVLFTLQCRYQDQTR